MTTSDSAPSTTKTVTTTLGAIIVTIGLFVVVVAWIAIVGLSIGKAPILNTDGSVKVDQFARAKDILVLLLPLLTTAAGYWLGSQGTGQAQKVAAVATETAQKAQAQKSAILAVTPVLPSGQDVLTAAKDAHPEAFR